MRRMDRATVALELERAVAKQDMALIPLLLRRVSELDCGTTAAAASRWSSPGAISGELGGSEKKSDNNTARPPEPVRAETTAERRGKRCISVASVERESGPSDQGAAHDRGDDQSREELSPVAAFLTKAGFGTEVIEALTGDAGATCVEDLQFLNSADLAHLGLDTNLQRQLRTAEAEFYFQRGASMGNEEKMKA